VSGPTDAPARASGPTDVVVVCVDTTSGWRAAANEFAGAVERAGASVEAIFTGPVRQVRTFALTDLVQARAARGATAAAIAAHQPRAIVYCSITATLLWPRPGAIWLDAIAAENRPGRHGPWQRVVERRRLDASPLVIRMSDRALEPLSRPDTPVVPVPVASSGPLDGARDIAAITYGGDPEKRRLDLVLDTWSRTRRGDETLVVAGIDGLPPRDGVTVAGRLAPSDYRALLRRARVFVCAPRREEYGIAPLEALADGCMLVTTPARGGYPAFGLARSLDARLATDDLAAALRAALDSPVPGYTERAAELLAPFTRESVDLIVARDVLPRLLPGFGAR
jgi:glycosyltransferase involved in cell wall biosynthesis